MNAGEAEDRRGDLMLIEGVGRVLTMGAGGTILVDTVATDDVELDLADGDIGTRV